MVFWPKGQEAGLSQILENITGSSWPGSVGILVQPLRVVDHAQHRPHLGHVRKRKVASDCSGTPSASSPA